MRSVSLLLMLALLGCELSSVQDRTVQAVAGPGGVTAMAVQAVAGPGGVIVTATPVAGELVVSWSADAAEPFKYYVFQSNLSSGPFVQIASVLKPDASPPAPTSYTVDGLAAGQYCYALKSAYSDGTESDLGAARCGTVIVSGSVPPQPSLTFSPGLATFSVPGGGDTGPSRVDPFFNNFIKTAGGPTTGKIYEPIILSTGNTLLSWSLLVSKTSAPPATLTAKLFRVSHSIGTQIGHTQTISTAPGTTVIGEMGLSETVVPGFYFVEVSSPNSGAGQGTDQTEELTIFYNPTPAP
jgi:hypothetical protein